MERINHGSFGKARMSLSNKETATVEETCGSDPAMGVGVGRKIWIDLDNSPHVPFFAPIIGQLEGRGHTVVVTVRDFAQVTQLAELLCLRYKTVGRHYGKRKLFKIVGVFVRAAQLASTVWRFNPDLVISHGSRPQLLLSSMLRIPSIDISDYEHATDFKVIRPSWIMAPALIPSDRWDIPSHQVLQYPGIKEDVYVPQFEPDPEVLAQLKIPGESVLVTVRPPASHAHYHNPESDDIFKAVLNRLVKERNVVTVLLPRTPSQELEIRNEWGKYLDSGLIIIPPQAVDGLNLMWHSDLVISGGGTMNREAAALHVPVYSTFRGKLGAVDKYLVESGRLVLVGSAAEVNTHIKVMKRERKPESLGDFRTLSVIVSHIETVLGNVCRQT
jgi:predicted glycosyltransferase